MLSIVVLPATHLFTWVVSTRAANLEAPFDGALVAILGVPLFPPGIS
jgi:hypothetical protein